jgi:VanZ family protein
VFVLSSIPDTPAMPGNSDKGVHGLLYFPLGALLVRALAGGWGARVSATVALVATLLAGAYGVSDEIHQHFVPPRQADPYDAVADTTGAAVAAFGLCLVRRRGGRGRNDRNDRGNRV